MSIETEIEGDPSAVRAASRWLSDTLGDRIDGGAAGVRKAEGAAAADWTSEAGMAFGTKMSAYEAEAKKVSGQVSKGATAMTTYASALATAQSAMGRIRETARGAGLTVTGTVIHNPGSYPGAPGPLPDGASDADLTAHARLTAAHEKGAALATAYEAAMTDYTTHVALLNEAIEAFWDAVTFTVADEGSIFPGFVAAGASGVASLGAKELLRNAKTWTDELERVGARNLADPHGFTANFDDYLRHDKTLLDARARSARLAGLTRLSKIGGPLLTIAGIGVDLANGEPVDQAVGSNVGGAVAGTAAGVVTTTAISAGASALAAAGVGAAAGSAVPVVGTIVGALVGAGVGYVVSGALDEHWDEIKDGLGDAVDAGEDIVKGGADIVTGGADKIKSGIGKLFG